MRFELNASDGQETTPTFFQWCKSNLESKTPERFIVTKIWLPNKYPDLTLETEKFRLRIHHKASVFSSIRDSIDKFVYDNVVLAISEIDKASYDYTLEVLDGEVAQWSELGSSGWKCEVQSRPARKSRTAKS